MPVVNLPPLPASPLCFGVPELFVSVAPYAACPDSVPLRVEPSPLTKVRTAVAEVGNVEFEGSQCVGQRTMKAWAKWR
jgi:hypothetical protein